MKRSPRREGALSVAALLLLLLQLILLLLSLPAETIELLPPLQRLLVLQSLDTCVLRGLRNTGRGLLMLQLDLLPVDELLLLQLLLQLELMNFALLVQIEIRLLPRPCRALVHLQLQGIHVLALLLQLALHCGVARVSGERAGGDQ